MTSLQKKIEATLEQLLLHKGNTRLQDAMGYSLLAGGKRIRPLLYLMHLREFQELREEDFAFAAAIEMIHCYSLIHDDLPAMDDDDLRRGKPTNHKVYGEAMAILAGDALLNRAFEVCFELAQKDPIFISLGHKLSQASSDHGMILGQVLDMEYEGKEMEEDVLHQMLLCKTGELIALPIEAAALRSSQTNPESWKKMGLTLGLAFQVKDDLLDQDSTAQVLGKTPGKDEKAKKNSYVQFYGYEQSKVDYERMSKEILGQLSLLSKDESLMAFYEALLERKY